MGPLRKPELTYVKISSRLLQTSMKLREGAVSVKAIVRHLSKNATTSGDSDAHFITVGYFHQSVFPRSAGLAANFRYTDGYTAIHEIPDRKMSRAVNHPVMKT